MSGIGTIIDSAERLSYTHVAIYLCDTLSSVVAGSWGWLSQPAECRACWVWQPHDLIWPVDLVLGQLCCLNNSICGACCWVCVDPAAGVGIIGGPRWQWLLEIAADTTTRCLENRNCELCRGPVCS